MRVLGFLGRAVLMFGLLLEVGAVAFLVLNPSPDAPSDAVGQLVYALVRRGVTRTIANDTVVGFGLNVALFAPLGLLLGLMFCRVHWLVWGGLAALVSSVLEITQLVLLSDRTATVDDVIANTLGATLGALAAATLVALAQALRRGVRTLASR